MVYVLLKAGHLVCVLIFIAGLVQNGFLLRNLDRAGPDFAALIARGRAFDQRLTAPALGGVWLFGLALTWEGAWFPDPWLLAKLVFVLALSALHGMQQATMRRIEASPEAALPPHVRHSAAITLCLVGLIVVFVTIKPI